MTIMTNDSVICHNCHLFAWAQPAKVFICKHISQYKNFRSIFFIPLITNKLQHTNFEVRKPWLSLLQTLSLHYLNSHFSPSKLPVSLPQNHLVKFFHKTTNIRRVWQLLSCDHFLAILDIYTLIWWRPLRPRPAPVFHHPYLMDNTNVWQLGQKTMHFFSPKEEERV